MALTKVSGDFIQDGSITQGHLHASHGITTSDIGEGSNLYFTTARVNTAVGNLSTSDLSEGTNLYYTQARFNTAFAAKSTSDLSEGTNLYYTDARVGSYLTTNSYATQSYVNTQVSNLVDSAPSTLDTLNELAAALGDDANFSTTVTNSIATKMPLAGGTFTGQVNFSVAPFLTQGVDLVFQAASGSTDPGDLVWRDGSNNERHRIWDGTNTLNYRTANGTTYQLIHSGYSSYNNSNWDTAYGWGDHASGGYLASSSYTAADVLSKILTVDGPGSGLNADLLDGIGGDGYLRSNAADSMSAQLTMTGNNLIVFGPNSGWSKELAIGGNANNSTSSRGSIGVTNGNLHIDAANGSYATYLNFYDGTGGVAFGSGATGAVAWMGPDGDLWKGSADNTGYRYWHAANDGAGSTLDADLLDGIDSASFVRSDADDTLSGQYTFTKTNDHAIKVGTIRGTAVGSQTGEFIQMYNRVNIGGPSGWGASNTATPTYGLSTYGGTRLSVYNDYTESGGSMRAPIFYDSNNTARYIDPTSLSVLYRIQSTQAQASPRWDTAFYVLQAQHWYGDNSSQTMFLGEGSNTIQVPGSGGIRPKIVYDYDNTSFYLNPDGTSNLSTLSTDTNEGIFNNQRRNHSTYQNFNDTGLRAGINYLQQGSNGPTGTASHQWYGWRLGLGGDYGTQTGSSGHYAQEWYIARKGQGGNSTGGNFLWTRDMESGSWGSWQKVDTDRLQLASGYAVTMGSWGLRNVTPDGYIELGPANTSHAHIYTDRPNIYTNVPVIINGGTTLNSGDVRSPIFYDSNSTAYYANPSDISSLFGVAIRGDNDTTGTSNQIFFWAAGNTTTSAIGFKANGGYFTNPTGSGDGYNTYLTMDTDGRGWVFRRGVGGSNFGAAYTSGWILNNGIWQANASMRAPIFYDSNNTGYYVDPASTSNVNVINASGECNFTKSTYPMFVYGNGSTAGSSAVGLQVYSSGGNGAIMAFHRGGQYAVNMGLDSDNVLRIGGWSASSNRWTLDMSGHNIVAGSSRAPIFYDSGNTGYYVDPASWSNLSSGRVGSYLQIGTTGNTTHTPGINMAIGSDIYWRQSTYSNNADVWMESVDNATYLTWKLRVSSFDTTSWTDSIVVFNHNFWRGYVGILRSPEYPLDLNGQARLSGGYTTSDVRLKKNIRDNELGLSHLLQLRTRLFDWITDEEILGRTLAFQNSLLDCRGFIAQEVEEVVPELVDTSEGDQPTKSIDDGAVTAMMVKAIQEQQAIIDDLKARIEILENQ